MTHQRKILKVNCLMLKTADFERFIFQQSRKPIPVAQGNWPNPDSAIHLFTFLNLDSQNVQHGSYEYNDQIIGVFYFFFVSSCNWLIICNSIFRVRVRVMTRSITKLLRCSQVLTVGNIPILAKKISCLVFK